MEANRLGINTSPKVVPRMRLDNDTFAFVKDLKVGDKGEMSFSAIVKSHKAQDEGIEGDEETKRLKFTNIEQKSKRSVRLS